ncbi:kynureninase [Flavihumibacter petaseus]|uniref:Kynureninase n=1 Tax=Flavihumibacter petaseus NBRC 106054 TaxID=1220578 RepID=A0A0E9N6X0_9BACT|nr:kynureninase [Flavihumibacter petaseus]GAO45548.1 kynureninase [Flavihumibacter petaseus NBRC 106054]
METSYDYALSLDAADPLREFRDQFVIPLREGREQIYFLGNSLGLQPRKTHGKIKEVLQQWSDWGVEAFFMGEHPWLDFHEKLADPMSMVVGALPHEVVVMNQLTVNLHLMLASFYRPTGKRFRIICEAKAFPSDQYMLETHLKFLGFDPDETIIEVSPRRGEHTIRTEDILQAIKTHESSLALILWGGVQYYTGQVFDMETITKAGHAAGAVVGFDLAHAAGNVPLRLHDWQVDFAAWCNYKYMNGGPGAIGGAFIHERYHGDPSLPRLAGWWGYDASRRFKMEKGFVPDRGAAGWQLSTPSPLQYACLQASLEIFTAAGMPALHEKGRALNDYLIRLLESIVREAGERAIEIITPIKNPEKGCQVSLLMHRKGKETFSALQQAGIFADWREPNVIRVAPVPLYNRFTEVWQFADCLRRML